MSAVHERGALRIGVIGVGRIGRMHAEMVAREVGGAVLVAVADGQTFLAEGVAHDLGVAAMSVDELMADSTIDAVAICSSTDSHVHLLVAAANAGKAVFCEKPISLDLEEIDRALRAVEVNEVPLMIGFNRRFDPAHEAIYKAVSSGESGEPHLVRISSRDPAPPNAAYIKVSGGIFLDMTIHDFDMARFVTGSEVTEVFAQGAVRIDAAIGELGDLDTAVVTLRHKNGCLTVIDNSRQAVYGYDQRVEVFGSNGMAASENPLANTSMVRTAEGTRQPPLAYFFLERYRTSYLREWQAFVHALNEGGSSPITGADGRAPLVIGLAAKRSIEFDRPVKISEFHTAG